MTSLIFRGSCLCGSVQYEISGEAKKFYHCHCKRCRKATGTGHASNLLVKPGSIKWLKGEESIKGYKVPEAIRFTNRFCSVCGGRVPRYVPETDFIDHPGRFARQRTGRSSRRRAFSGIRARAGRAAVTTCLLVPNTRPERTPDGQSGWG